MLERLNSIRYAAATFAEKQQTGRRKWQGKRVEQQAVYQIRRRVQVEYGKRLLRRPGELLERSFAHLL